MEFKHQREPGSQNQPEPLITRNKDERVLTNVTVPLSPKSEEHTRKRKRVAGAALLCVVVSLFAAVNLNHFHTSALENTSREQTLTLSGADLAQATTAAPDNALSTSLSDAQTARFSKDVELQILNGQRLFFALPINETTPARGDKIRVDFNGTIFGVYALDEKPFTLTLPLKAGDHLTVTCLSLAQNKSSLTLEIATNLNPVISLPLIPGASQTWSVGHSSGYINNYTWFETEAAKGNATAQYGLGHMYQYGIGVPQNTVEAAKWFRLAAAQAYPGAEGQLHRLGY